jgi:adenylate cyclase
VRQTAIGVVVLLFIVAASVATWRAMQPKPEAVVAAARAPLRSVMIMPFSTPAGDPALAATTARLSDDVTRALGDSMRGVRIVPPTVAATLAAKSADPKAMGREANVSFLVDGELRPAGSEVAITLRLVDANDGKQIENVRNTIARAKLDDTDAVVRQLTMLTRVLVSEAIARDVAARGDRAASAQDLVDRVMALSLPDVVASAREGFRLSDEATRLDPNLAAAWAMRASGAIDMLANDFSADPDKMRADADADSFRAVFLDPRDPLAWRERANALGFAGKLDDAFAANDRARALDPTRYSLSVQRAGLFLLAGKPEETMKVVAQIRSDLGADDESAHLLACEALAAMGAYDEAIRECERSATTQEHWFLHGQLASAYALRGDVAKAAQAKERLLKAIPGFTISRYEARRLNPTPESLAMNRAHFIAGLRKAGVPE